jgi:TrmH family RNA methyltransferase
VQRITSRQNAVVREYRDAARGDLPGTILIDGAHLLDEALSSGLRFRHVIVSADAVSHAEIADLLHRAHAHGATLAAATSVVMDAVSPVRSSSSIVALAARPVPSTSPYDGGTPPLVLVMCDVQNPGNVGALVRVAEAAGASGVVIAGQSADPYGWKALRGSMGSALRLPIASAPSVHEAFDEARRRRVPIVATVPRNGTSHVEAQLDGPLALFIGGEGVGLPPEIVGRADRRVSIDMNPPVESLNAAIAAAILLYEARRQRSRQPA